MITVTRRARHAWALLALGLCWLLITAAGAAAQTPEWEIRAFDADITIGEDGSLEIVETIRVQFHVPSRGIYREIPFRYPLEDDDSTVRRFRFDRVEVETSSGAPDDLSRETSGDFHVWRIGDPDRYLTGSHTYTISYRVRGALNRFEDHDELFWNVTGDRWDVPVNQTTATVHAPAIDDVRCFAGASGDTQACADATHDGQTARFRAAAFDPGEQVDVVVAMPSGAVEVPEPMLEPASAVLRVFRTDGPRTAGALAVAVVGLAGVGLIARRGRDERPGAVEGLPGGVEYRPPDGLRPAQLRTLLSQKVDDVSLSSTLVDLAVRGYVHIEEAQKAKGKGQDWLVHRRRAVADDLEPFEKKVLRGLFGSKTVEHPEAGKTAVRVSDLGDGTFHEHYEKVSDLLYRDVVDRGFFAHDPSTARLLVGGLGVGALVAGVGGIVGMFVLDWTFGLVLAPLPVIGLLLLLVSRWAPRRTAVGSAMTRRVEGFRDFVRTAEADRMDFAEREQIFVTYLPYAMAFDCVDRWVQAFERMGVPAAAATGNWYAGTGHFDTRRMTSSMTSLASQVGGTMRETAASSGSSGMSGGSSGGGGGGGGGGRW